MAVPPPDVNFTFSNSELEELKVYGDARSHEEGDILVREGDRNVDCLVTLFGHTDIMAETHEGQKRLGCMAKTGWRP